MQTCNKCLVLLPISCFEHQKNRPNPRKTCKKCRYLERDLEKEKTRHREYMSHRRITNPDALRQNWERAKYGVCKEDLHEKSCIICGSTQRLCIDHCHQTKKVRGLLCTKCNTGLGMFDDDIGKLLSAIEYLRR